ncbi:NCS1 nucleoside transporter family protein [Neolentinus lepideus HHB14362 ss-1]|uniref:NCS1 nucleoside transporter family protein n=1 Tax=Neolentinus lepideus HHB14362 ss-1 TaxID=1314782 RepID=A0A165PCF8_9AGAM|nr:NCS1 nucleoside transporter family protein [Neolentinus lepideus HHB14362 ss-1]
MESALKYLRVHSEGESSVWINDDIRPLPPSRRTWDRYAFISFWAINQICLSNWQTGSSLVAVGLSVWQTMVAVIIAKIIISLVAIFNGYVGAEWHIGFPVVSRYVWGVYGSYLSLLQRIVLSLVWFSVQSWTGGLCVAAILASIFPSFQHMANTMPTSTHMTTKQFVGWVVYNIVSVPILYIPPEKTKRLLIVMNAISFFTLISIMIWALSQAHGGGPLLSQPAAVSSGSNLGWAIVSGITTVIGSIAVGLTNQPDYSRFAHRPGDQIFGQWFSIIFFGTVMPLFGCLASSATVAIYGEALWNPPDIVLKWLDTDYTAKSRAAAFFAGVGLVVCQLAINTIDNAFSTGMDLAGLFPKYLNIRRGAYIGLVLSIIMQPWQLLSSASTFIAVLSAYSVFLGPMIGMQVCDYWVIRRRRIKLSDLYSAKPSGIYYYYRGWNWRAFVAWIVGWASQIPGFANAVNPDIKVPVGSQHLYYLAFPVGFCISFLVFWVVNKLSPPRGLGEVDEVDCFGTFSREEADRLGINLAAESQSSGAEDVNEKNVDLERSISLEKL